MAAGSKRVSRKSLSPLAQPELPSIESSLDAFIARANETPLEEPYVPAENREASLLREVGALKSQLAEAEVRAAARARSSRRWGAIVVAFVAGCATMFAYGALAPKRDAPPSATAAAMPSPQVVAPRESHVTVTPIATPPPEPVATPAPAATPEPAVEPPKPTRKPAARPAPHTTPSAPASPAPAAKKQSGSGFYDPF